MLSQNNLELAPLRDRLVQKLASILKPRSEIRLAYLFGSMSKGRIHAHSDIDIGLILESHALSNHWYPIELNSDIEAALKGTEFGRFHIDVRVLNSSTVKFLYHVIFQNPRIINRNNEFRIQFEKDILLKWYDMRPTWESFYQERRTWLIEQGE